MLLVEVTVTLLELTQSCGGRGTQSRRRRGTQSCKEEKHSYVGRKNTVTRRAVTLEMQSRGDTDAEEAITLRNQSRRRRKQSRVHAGAYGSR